MTLTLVGGLVAMNFIFPEILGISSSQLTNSYFSEGWPNHQPVLIFFWSYLVVLGLVNDHHVSSAAVSWLLFFWVDWRKSTWNILWEKYVEALTAGMFQACTLSIKWSTCPTFTLRTSKGIIYIYICLDIDVLSVYPSAKYTLNWEEGRFPRARSQPFKVTFYAKINRLPGLSTQTYITSTRHHSTNSTVQFTTMTWKTFP